MSFILYVPFFLRPQLSFLHRYYRESNLHVLSLATLQVTEDDMLGHCADFERLDSSPPVPPPPPPSFPLEPRTSDVQRPKTQLPLPLCSPPYWSCRNLETVGVPPGVRGLVDGEIRKGLLRRELGDWGRDGGKAVVMGAVGEGKVDPEGGEDWWMLLYLSQC